MPNQNIRDYFDFSRRERTGIACLLILIILAYSLPYGLNYLPQKAVDTLGFGVAAAAVEALMRRDSSGGAERRPYQRNWHRHNNYRVYEKGRRYEKQWDSAYRRSGKWRDSLRPYVKLYEKRPPAVIDINAADSAQWERLPGIGPVLAQRIVRFRDRLGGFHEIAQVGETFGLADSVFKKIQGMLVPGAVSLRKTDLNNTDEKSLALHPYINTKLARVIVRYRNSHGPFRHVGELKGIALVNDSIYRKLEKYLTVP